MQYNFDQITDRRGTNCVKWDECQNPDVLPLWVADMDFPTAPCVQEAVMRRATHGCYGYTLVPDAYYEAIRTWFATRHQWNIQRDEILYTIGVIPAIAAVLKAHCQVGDNVVMLTPVYNCFFNLIRNAGCQTISIPLNENLTANVLSYDIDWEKLEEALALEKSTTLLFCNPHNPVGRLWTEEELLRVAQLCQKHNVLLISDEIHNELTTPHRLYVPMGRTLTSSPKYVVCLSPSKSFNTAGLQNAFLVCPDADLRRRIDRAINLNETCDVNPFGVEALIAAYNEGGEWLDELRQYIYANFRFSSQELSGIPGMRWADLQGTYLMWLDCREYCSRNNLTSQELCRRLIIDAHVWLCAGTIYGQEGEGYVRLNLACPRATLTEALQRMKAFFLAKQ